MDQTETRRPLGSMNTTLGSKLPQVQSKLRQPTPVKSIKRKMSPEDNERVEKKARITKATSLTNLSSTRPPSKANISGSRATSRLNTSASSSYGSIGYKRATTSQSTIKRKPVASTVRSVGAKTPGSRLPPKPAPKSAAKPPTGASSAQKGKRPVWDLKGRLQDMESMMSDHMKQNGTLLNQVSSNQGRISLLETINHELEGTVAEKEKETTYATEEIQVLKKKLRDAEDTLENSQRKMKREIVDLEEDKKKLSSQKEDLDVNLKITKGEVVSLKSTISTMTTSQMGMKAEFEATKLSLEESVREGKIKDCTNAELRKMIENQKETIENMNNKIVEHETTRRKLHNTIQELKGNIRVFCRVRPLLGEELLGNNGEVSHLSFPDEEQKILEIEKLSDAGLNESSVSVKKGATNSYQFQFDKVFRTDSTQADVFDEISQLVQSALDGYNVCIFAYGQTGSGKTFTMEGPTNGTEETKGMIPRAVDQVFDTARELENKGWQYQFVGSFLEIYNENIRDLLGDGKEQKHDIKMVASGSNEVLVSNLTTINVTQEKQVHELLKKAAVNRAVAETKCNTRSSRSHSVFQLKISGKNDKTSEHCQGILNLIDLAGSERLKESGAEGMRLKETQAINKSLSCLGNVIMALANKDPHVPYRNSKLTHLLQNSLGGNSKTLMFVNVSPKEECFGETLCSLRFATKVNNCNIGTAQKKVK